MREILFRGKRIGNGEWVFGDFCNYNDTAHIKNKHDLFYGVIPETVGQYTGLTDKNGTKIFEGDILAIKFYHKYVERISWEGRPDAIAKVFWDLNAFRLRAKNDVDIRYADFCDICYEETEVIGNIHDNPELLHT